MSRQASARLGREHDPGYSAEQVGHVMILRDITESRRTAQQTIESERLNALTVAGRRCRARNR